MVNNLLLYGTPVMANPTKAYILMTQEPTEKMPKKWIKVVTDINFCSGFVTS